MKKAIGVIGCLILITIGLTACDQTSDQIVSDEIVILKMGHYSVEGHPAHEAALQFAKNVEERTGGQVIVEIYADGQLGTPPEMLEQNIIGSIDMSLPTQGALDKYSKKFATVMLPFVFEDYQHAYDVLDGAFTEWVKEDLEKQGLVMLANWEYGFRNITNNVQPIEVPEDVVGLRLRTPPEIQLEVAMESLGANVTKIAYPEIYLSLQQGVVDGQENPLTVIYYDKLYEVQNYLAMTQHTYNCMVHVISQKTWELLSEEQQAIIREESIHAGNWMREEIQLQEAEIIVKLQEAGMIITYPDRSVFQDKMQYAYDTITTYAGKENVAYFLEMVEDAR